jgi:hypothetical protein
MPEESTTPDLARLSSRGAAVFHDQKGAVTRLVRYWDVDDAPAALDRTPEGEAS